MKQRDRRSHVAATIILGLAVTVVLGLSTPARAGLHGGAHLGGHHGGVHLGGHHGGFHHGSAHFGGHHGSLHRGGRRGHAHRPHLYGSHYAYLPGFGRYHHYAHGYPYTSSYAYGRYAHHPAAHPRTGYAIAAAGDARGDGWALIAADEAGAARNAFAIEAESHPDEGLPKAGYAISSAALGDDARAHRAMRRALRFEPKALHDVPVDDPLRDRLGALIERYEQRIRDGHGSPDDQFMVAALAYVRGDYELAEARVDGAVESGDSDPTTLALKGLIAEQR